MKHFLAHMLTAVGALALLVAVFAAVVAAIALNERIRFGPGLLFADVEILAMLTLSLCAVGLAVLWFGRTLLRRTNPGDTP